MTPPQCISTIGLTQQLIWFITTIMEFFNSDDSKQINYCGSKWLNGQKKNVCIKYRYKKDWLTSYKFSHYRWSLHLWAELCMPSKSFSRDTDMFTSFCIQCWREKALDALFSFPFMSSTIKPKCWNIVAHLIKWLVVFVEERRQCVERRQCELEWLLRPNCPFSRDNMAK